MEACLISLNKWCSELKVYQLALPTIVCSLDLLAWPKLHAIICDIFQTSKIWIIIFHQKPSMVTNSKYQEDTIILKKMKIPQPEVKERNQVARENKVASSLTPFMMLMPSGLAQSTELEILNTHQKKGILCKVSHCKRQLTIGKYWNKLFDFARKLIMENF